MGEKDSDELIPAMDAAYEIGVRLNTLLVQRFRKQIPTVREGGRIFLSRETVDLLTQANQIAKLLREQAQAQGGARPDKARLDKAGKARRGCATQSGDRQPRSKNARTGSMKSSSQKKDAQPATIRTTSARKPGKKTSEKK